MSDMIILLLVLCVLAFLYYGGRALIVCAVSVVTAVVCDALCTLIRGRRPNPRDLSPVVTGLIIALTMPATIPYYVVASAAVFAIAIVKHPFGGTGQNLFNPGAAGFSFAAICWPGLVFMYPMPFDRIPAFGEVTAQLYQNPAFVLKVGGVPTNNLTELLFGNYPGPMGATNILVRDAALRRGLRPHRPRHQPQTGLLDGGVRRLRGRGRHALPLFRRVRGKYALRGAHCERVRPADRPLQRIAAPRHKEETP